MVLGMLIRRGVVALVALSAVAGCGAAPASSTTPVRIVEATATGDEVLLRASRDDGSHGDDEADAALEHATRVVATAERLGRSGVDGWGAPLRVLIHAAAPENPELMAADGWDPNHQRIVLGPHRVTLDTIAHHFMMGTLVTSAFPREPSPEAQALRIAISDIFATMVEPDSNWVVEALADGSPRRDLSAAPRVRGYDPAASPAVNSTSVSHAYFQLRRHVSPAAAARIAWIAAFASLGPDAGFADYRHACLVAAEGSFGPQSFERRAAELSFAAAGITGQ